MFTGIVEEVGIVESNAGTRLLVTATKTPGGLKPGDSMAINGACLTVTAVTGHGFSVDVMPETLRRSNLGSLVQGERVNLERAAVLGGRVGGHLVQGHVDATGRVMSLVTEGKAVLFRISAPENVMRYLVEKAFIAVDGASLTIARTDSSSFTVSLVEYTMHNTTLGGKKPGQLVNLEVDIVAKYVEHFVRTGGSGITMGFLAEHGYVVP
ncbi:MAG: riboflavin synthase [Chloroflexota bacterium]